MDPAILFTRKILNLYWETDNSLILFKENNKGKKDPPKSSLFMIFLLWKLLHFITFKIILWHLNQPKLRGNNILKSSPWLYKYIFINNAGFSLPEGYCFNQRKMTRFSHVLKPQDSLDFKVTWKMNIPY